MKYSFRKAQESDLPFLLSLRKETMDEHLIRSGISLSDEEHIKRINYQFESAQIILLDQKAIGLLKTQTKTDHLEIIQLQISKAYQGRGLGKQVLDSLRKEAAQRKLFLSLSVLRGNKAKTLYERVGFMLTDETEDSFVMQTPKDYL